MRTGLWTARSDLIEDGRRTASARIANRFAGDPLHGGVGVLGRVVTGCYREESTSGVWRRSVIERGTPESGVPRL